MHFLHNKSENIEINIYISYTNKFKSVVLKFKKKLKLLV